VAEKKENRVGTYDTSAIGTRNSKQYGTMLGIIILVLESKRESHGNNKNIKFINPKGPAFTGLAQW
jgi:hypothetical protein